MQRFSNLKVWQRSHALALEFYRQTKSFPDDERYGLTSQLRRAVTSIPTNLAEGSTRQTAGDYARFLNIAEGSTSETLYLLLLARDLGYLSQEQAAPLIIETEQIGKMLFALRRKVQAGAP